MNLEELKLDELRADALDKLRRADSEKALSELKTLLFGKAGALTALMRTLKDIPPEQKPQAGKLINDVRVELIELCNAQEKVLHKKAIDAALNAESADLTIDKPIRSVGAIHPLNQIRSSQDRK